MTVIEAPETEVQPLPDDTLDAIRRLFDERITTLAERVAERKGSGSTRASYERTTATLIAGIDERERLALEVLALCFRSKSAAVQKEAYACLFFSVIEDARELAGKTRGRKKRTGMSHPKEGV